MSIHTFVDELMGTDLRALADLGCLPHAVVPRIVQDIAMASAAEVLVHTTIALFEPEPDIQHVGPWLDLDAGTGYSPRPFGEFVRGSRWGAPQPALATDVANSAEYVTDVDEAYTLSETGVPLELAVVLVMKSGDARIASWRR